jgi:hypothetical protein
MAFSLMSGITWEQVDTLHPMSWESGKIMCLTVFCAAVRGDVIPTVRRTAATNFLELAHVEGSPDQRLTRHLVAAGVVLVRHQNQPRRSFRGPLFGRSAASLQDADNRGVGRDNTNPDRSYHGKAENQRHEKRNHDQPPCLFAVRSRSIQMPPDPFSSMRQASM